MEKRPVLKLTLSPLDRNLEFAGKLLLAAVWLLTLYALLKLPVTIPIHFNASGQADRYGNKLTLLFLPVLATVIYVGFTYLNRYPHIFNYPAIIKPNSQVVKQKNQTSTTHSHIIVPVGSFHCTVMATGGFTQDLFDLIGICV